jgi:hypothetical protein
MPRLRRNPPAFQGGIAHASHLRATPPERGARAQTRRVQVRSLREVDAPMTGRPYSDTVYWGAMCTIALSHKVNCTCFVCIEALKYATSGKV